MQQFKLCTMVSTILKLDKGGSITINNMRLYQTIIKTISKLDKGRINQGTKESARPQSSKSSTTFVWAFHLQQNLCRKKGIKRIIYSAVFFSCASHTVKLYYLEYILWRYWPQAGPTFIGLYPGNSEKQPLRNRNPYASWKWSQKAQTNTNTTTATEKLESNMQH